MELSGRNADGRVSRRLDPLERGPRPSGLSRRASKPQRRKQAGLRAGGPDESGPQAQAFSTKIMGMSQRNNARPTALKESLESDPGD